MFSYQAQHTERGATSFMNTVTQDMRYLQSLVNHALRHGVKTTTRKYNRSRSYIYFWLKRYDGSIESLAKQSRRPHSHPNAHTQQELTLISNHCRRNPDIGMIELWCRLRNKGYTRSLGGMYRVLQRQAWFKPPKSSRKYIPKPYEQMQYPGQRVQIDVKVVPRTCIANPELRLFQYTAIDEYSRMRYLCAYEEQSTYSSADFLRKATAFFSRNGVKVECVQTDNGFEFTNRFSPSKRDLQTLFEKTAGELRIRHKLIRPYTPRHNGKVERSHREDQKRFYSCHSFYSIADLDRQLAVYLNRSNNIPMRPLSFLSPKQFLRSYFVQYV